MTIGWTETGEYHVDFMAAGNKVGRLTFADGIPIRFEGDAELSAWTFFDALGEEFEARFGQNPTPARREEYEPGAIRRSKP